MPGRALSRFRFALAASLVGATVTIALAAPPRNPVAPIASSANILDGYVFPGPDPSRVVVVMDVGTRVPRGASSSMFFDPNVLYAIDVDNVGDGLAHLSLQFQASGTGPMQRITAFGPAVPANAGSDSTRFAAIGTTVYNRTSPIDKGISLFAGPRRDPFFFDRAQFDRIVTGKATCFNEPGKSDNAYRADNVLAIVAEIPKTLLAPRKLGRIGVWWTASIPSASGDTFRQVARVGRPGRDLAGLPSAASRSTALAAAISTFFASDEVQADVEAPGQAGYLTIETATPTPSPLVPVKKPPPAYRPFGGRDLTSPAMARTLAVLYGDVLPRAGLGPEDGRETLCLETDNTTPAPNPAASSFPYLDDPL